MVASWIVWQMQNRDGQLMVRKRRSNASAGREDFYTKDNCRDRCSLKRENKSNHSGCLGSMLIAKKWYHYRDHHKHASQQHTKRNASHLSDSISLLLSDRLFQKTEWMRTSACMCGVYLPAYVCPSKWRVVVFFFCCREGVEGDKDSVSGKCTWIASHQLPICCAAAVTGEGLGGGLWQNRPAADGEENNFWCQ